MQVQLLSLTPKFDNVVFIQQPINFHVDEYKMLWHFPSYLMKDGESSGKQIEQIRALNNSDLNHMYEYFYLNKFVF